MYKEVSCLVLALAFVLCCVAVFWIYLSFKCHIDDPEYTKRFSMLKEPAGLLKLPTFWTSKPDEWFAQAKAQFNLCGITADNTRYYVLAALDQEMGTRLIDLISQPPDTNKYVTLKLQLVDTFELDKWE